MERSQEQEPEAEIKIIKFGENLLVPTLTEDKKISLRKYRPEAHSLKEGEFFIGSFEDGLDIVLQATCDTEVKRFRDLIDSEAQEDNFRDAKDAINELRNYYPDLVLDDKLAIIRYEIPKTNGVPSVRINK